MDEECWLMIYNMANMAFKHVEFPRYTYYVFKLKHSLHQWAMFRILWWNPKEMMDNLVSASWVMAMSKFKPTVVASFEYYHLVI